jgi:deoxyribodipyrimidine photo-lyase
MHGWLRMYWAKQLLLWSADAETALFRVLRLNDTLSLDGRDVNGYAGAAWSIGGVHDRPWPERPVFGTVRSMTASGAARKFDTRAFIARWGRPGV